MTAASLFRRKETRAADPAAAGRIGIIDIGSNSIRLVVYNGPERVPAVIFNEKVMAGLGRGLSQSGEIDPEAMARGIAALERFRLLADQIGVAELRTVATAAVRDASNGDQFLARLVEMGLEPELLSGDAEARAAGFGVISAMPDADGIVGDLGGGSLELVRVAEGGVHERASFPLGVLRVASLRERRPGTIDRVVQKMVAKAGWEGRCEGKPFYMVGGSWRALARLDMHLSDHALPIVHNYAMAPESASRLVRVLAHIQPRKLREMVGLSTSRIPNLSDAAHLLAALVKQLKPSVLIVSANGLREGLLFDALPESVKRQDPLICAAREMGAQLGRYAEHGDLLDRWIDPLFTDDSVGDRRLRLAASLLADIAWRAHPEFRAERGLEMALHGNWAGIDARGRAVLAHALYVNFGGTGRDAMLERLCTPDDLARAERWGLALRLGQRLSAGVADGLIATRISATETVVRLELSEGQVALYGESVERRLKALATAMGKGVELTVR